jgi:hypothetical protein
VITGRLRVLLLGVALLATLAPAGVAQTPARVRGSISELIGPVLVVKTREGPSVQVRLLEGLTVLGVAKAALADLQPGKYVGVAAVKQPDGTYRAQEITIFPDMARGSAEGHTPWDLTPDSTMTNATVEAVVARSAGPLLTLKHKDGEVKVTVPPRTPVVTFDIATHALLAPGAHVFVPAVRQPDGSLATTRILVGKAGVVPPM